MLYHEAFYGRGAKHELSEIIILHHDLKSSSYELI